MEKILLLTDSSALPRSVPVSDATPFEQTYPNLLKEELKDSQFYQFSNGNVPTSEILNHAISYFYSWKPDIIVIHSGLADCRLEAFSEFEKYLILNYRNPISLFLRKFLYNSSLIGFRRKRGDAF